MNVLAQYGTSGPARGKAQVRDLWQPVVCPRWCDCEANLAWCVKNLGRYHGGVRGEVLEEGSGETE
ncbi:hypothetical protein AB0F20_37860, partial [Streptomyces goshikiensis]|uniref:hypothetical protein n=1 Tax=Streptomyces goshikiensis TaxID=1942 RepID=UPI0033F40766